MKTITIKKLFNLHSWVGLITGILMFVIAFTGAMSVFARPELKIWASADMPASLDLDKVKIEKLVAEYAKDIPEPYREEVILFMPGQRAFKDLILLFEAHSGIEPTAASESQSENDQKSTHNPAMGISFQFDPHTLELKSKKQGELGTLFAARETDMADFIADFHADLHLGRPIGLILTGVLGLTLLLSIVTGIFIHRKIFSQIFTFRPQKSFSVLLNDGHKAIGIWGLMFHSVIAFTGAFLGLAFVVLVPAAAFVSFGGDQEQLIEAFVAIPDPVIQQVEKPTQIANILQQAQNLHDEAEVFSITVKGYGDASAMAYVNITGGNKIAPQTAVFNGADGSFIEQYSNFARIEGFSGEILDVLFPLHFGNFGGVFVKLIWTVLGLSTALLPLTGLMLWLERGVKSASPRYSMSTYKLFNKLVVGSCGGIVLACVALFPVQLILENLVKVTDVGDVIGWVFFPVWVLSILWGLIVSNTRLIVSQMTWVGAFMLLSVMPLNAWLSGRHIFNVFDGHWVSVSVDLFTLLTGIFAIYFVRKWSTDSSQKSAMTLTNEAVLEQG